MSVRSGTLFSWYLQIGSLSVGQEAETHFVQLYVIFMNQLVTVLPITADIPKAYQQGSDDEQEFVQNLAIFLTGFLKVQHHRTTPSCKANCHPMLTSVCVSYIASPHCLQKTYGSHSMCSPQQNVFQPIFQCTSCLHARTS